MKKSNLVLRRTMMGMAVLGSVLAGSPAVAQEAEALLKKADGMRNAGANTRTEISAKLIAKDGALIRERAYSVYSAGERKTLVVMRSSQESGQKVLMLDEQFWLVLPGSTRALRITPMQKLLGDAAVGDIATSSWSQDYKIESDAKELCEQKPCVKLELRALRPSATYQRIVLWVEHQSGRPLTADLFLQSDKLAKQARFVTGISNGSESVREMVMTDKLGNHRETRVTYGTATKKDVPKAWLNPMHLVGNTDIE